jgi:hypothetical protein
MAIRTHANASFRRAASGLTNGDRCQRGGGFL